MHCAPAALCGVRSGRARRCHSRAQAREAPSRKDALGAAPQARTRRVCVISLHSRWPTRMSAAAWRAGTDRASHAAGSSSAPDARRRIGFCAAIYHMHARAGAGLPATATAAAALSAHRYETRRVSRQRVQRSELRSGARAPSQLGLMFRRSTEVVRACVGARCAQPPVARAAGACELHRRERRPRGILLCAAPATLGGVCGCGMQCVACLLSLGVSHARPRTQPPHGRGLRQHARYGG